MTEFDGVPSSHFRGGRGWKIALLVAILFLLAFMVGITLLLCKGTGIWGINRSVFWGFAITNFIWWIGIGHAGTFISAILFLVRQKLRTEISRLAETMTIFAVACAGLFPLLHMGRPWFFYWLFPYYDTMNLWPQFRSPLVWDVFAVSTYLLVSLIFWYLGLITDLAIYRDRAVSQNQKVLYGLLAMGWRGSSEQWRAHRSCYLLLAVLATPLVISVHSIVGLDFSATQVAGWHSTLFPPYFVAGAIFSGFAMVITLAILIRRALHLEDVLTLRHFDLCAKFLLAMGVIVTYGYFMDVYAAYVSGDERDMAVLLDHYTGDYAVAGWTMLFCNCVAPLILWSHRARRSLTILFTVSIFVNIGMWLERFVIVVGSLNHNDLPASSRMFLPTLWDWIFLFGSMGLFATLYLLFARFFPILAISEMLKSEGEKE